MFLSPSVACERGLFVENLQNVMSQLPQLKKKKKRPILTIWAFDLRFLKGKKKTSRPNVPFIRCNTHTHNTVSLYISPQARCCRVEQRARHIAYSHRPASKTARQTGRKTERGLLISLLDLTLVLFFTGPVLKRVQGEDMDGEGEIRGGGRGYCGGGGGDAPRDRSIEEVNRRRRRDVYEMRVVLSLCFSLQG